MISALHPDPAGILTEVRDAAITYVERGWPIQPGTYQVHGSPYWHGKASTTGLEPIAEPWTDAGITDTTDALTLWTSRPYSIVMACGWIADAIEIPAEIALHITQPLRERGCLPPTVVTPFATWFLLVKPGTPLAPELARHPTIRVFGAGTWIPLPPTSHGTWCYRWRSKPSTPAGSLPSGGRVQQAVLDAALRARQIPSRAQARATHTSWPQATDLT